MLIEPAVRRDRRRLGFKGHETAWSRLARFRLFERRADALDAPPAGPLAPEPVMMVGSCIPESPLLSAALQYAALGWPIFPCDPATKRPRIRHGFKSATIEPASIRRWWKQWPAAMIGMPTGEPSGLVVLDIDVKRPFEADEIDGEKSWNDLLVVHGTGEPPTRIVHTPSGGRHLYFRWQLGMGNSAGRLGLGLDVRGQGGYVIVPPSVNAQSVAYELFHDRPVLPLPLWLASLLERDDG